MDIAETQYSKIIMRLYIKIKDKRKFTLGNSADDIFLKFP